MISKRFKSLLIFGLMLITLSCSENINQESSFSNDTLDSTSTDTILENTEIIDFGEQEFEILPTTDTSKFQGIDGYELYEEPPFLDADNHVIRKNDSLLFLLENGDSLFITNVPYVEGDGFAEGNEHLSVNYTFQGSVLNADYWEVQALGFECHWYVLINKKNGFKLTMSGNSIGSPNGKYLMAINPDIESGYTINCLELVEVLEDSLREIGTYEPPNWGPKSIKWLSGDELIMTKMTICEDSEFFEYCYENVLLKRIED